MSVQRFSIFHEASPAELMEWHKPYAKQFIGSGLVLDVGCGPGYFSQILCELGGKCVGVDFDERMVKMSNGRGQVAYLGDQTWMKDRKDEYGGVHISHVVEHLSGDELVTLLENAHAALKPGGLIVIRTPNWQNRFVRERLFWMDHTHKRPYPAELLSRMLTELGMTELESGAEPRGMNDTFVIAEKDGASKNGYRKLVFPESAADAPPKNVKAVLKQRLRRFLDL